MAPSVIRSFAWFAVLLAVAIGIVGVLGVTMDEALLERGQSQSRR